MAFGPGVYDAECTMVRERTRARAAIVIVLGGDRGNGFSMQADDAMPPEQLADILDNMTRNIRSTIAPKGSA